LGICWLLTACQFSPAPPAKVPVQVDRAVSGNTVELADKRRVRLIGIDAPSLSQQPWGNAAKDYLDDIVQQADRQFLLELSPTDTDAGKADSRQYGYLWRNEVLVNEQLVRAGHALAMTKYVSPQYEQRLTRAQSYARLLAVGIWSHTAPMRTSPRDFKTK
jgi:micrococcal nuclease